MNEEFYNNQQMINNSMNIEERNRQNYWASYYKTKITICYIVLIVITIISLLIIIDYYITELPPSDYSIKANYDYMNYSNSLYNYVSGIKILEIWINGKNVSNDTTSCEDKSGCEVLFIIDLSDCTSLKGMFSYIDGLKSISFSSGFNTHNIKDMSNLFRGCSYLRSIDISHFDTSSVTKMNGMFYNCYLLDSLDISNFNTEKVTNMNEMFYYISISSLDLSNFNTKNVVYMQNMFKYSDLTSIDLSNFNTTNVKYMSGMFFSCSYLKYIDISSFIIEDINDNFNLSSSLPENGKLRIKSEYKDKIITIPSSWAIEPVE